MNIIVMEWLGGRSEYAYNTLVAIIHNLRVDTIFETFVVVTKH